MNVALKQRIIGAFVLVALVAIFLPMLLNFTGKREVDRTTQIPPKPEIEAIEQTEPVRPQGITPAKTGNDIYQFGVDEKEQGVDLEAEQSGLNAEGIPKAWLVQVGGFRERDKAEKLMDSLRGDGYKAFIRSGPSSNGMLHRVFVGPKIEKQRAIDAKAAIDKKYQLESILVRFEP